MLRRKIYKGPKCPREQRVPRNRVFQEAKCAEKQSVLGSKVFQGEECSRKQTVLRDTAVRPYFFKKVIKNPNPIKIITWTSWNTEMKL